LDLHEISFVWFRDSLFDAMRRRFVNTTHCGLQNCHVRWKFSGRRYAMDKSQDEKHSDVKSHFRVIAIHPAESWRCSREEPMYCWQERPETLGNHGVIFPHFEPPFGDCQHIHDRSHWLISLINPMIWKSPPDDWRSSRFEWAWRDDQLFSKDHWPYQWYFW
jgi:hypothetical protein